jgi:predicted SprT family Zn-dependent metalloprotease
MAVREIPRAFEYTCDACGMVHRQENASGQHTNGCPPHWLRLRTFSNSDMGSERLFCATCSRKVVKAVNDIVKEGI